MKKALKPTSSTLLLLCLGYFIDFYDLTIMGVSYPELIREQFGISTTIQIQQTYLLISSFQTVGMFIGAILFGILGDKIGRASAIKYSILLYSLSTLAAIFTHSLPVFIALRMLSYIGLATEFSTSTILILESLPSKYAPWGTAILYSFGVLGGMTATSIGFISWQIMFLFGAIGGLLLYIGRSHIKESDSYLNIRLENKEKLGSWRELLGHKQHLLKLCYFFLILVPYFAMISLMFIFPNYIIKTYTLSYATKILLIGFFIGNIISSLLSGFFTQYQRLFIAISMLLFLALMTTYYLIPERALLAYSLGLGIVGGGYPILWAQIATRSFPIYIRSLASNFLYALGRGSGLIFNSIVAIWLATPSSFPVYSTILVSILFILAMFAIIKIKPYTT